MSSVGLTSKPMSFSFASKLAVDSFVEFELSQIRAVSQNEQNR